MGPVGLRVFENVQRGRLSGGGIIIPFTSGGLGSQRTARSIKQGLVLPELSPSFCDPCFGDDPQGKTYSVSVRESSGNVGHYFGGSCCTTRNRNAKGRPVDLLMQKKLVSLRTSCILLGCCSKDCSLPRGERSPCRNRTVFFCTS